MDVLCGCATVLTPLHLHLTNVSWSYHPRHTYFLSRMLSTVHYFLIRQYVELWVVMWQLLTWDWPNIKWLSNWSIAATQQPAYWTCSVCFRFKRNVALSWHHLRKWIETWLVNLPTSNTYLTKHALLIGLRTSFWISVTFSVVGRNKWASLASGCVQSTTTKLLSILSIQRSFGEPSNGKVLHKAW